MKEVLALLEDLKTRFNAHQADCAHGCLHVFEERLVSRPGLICTICGVTWEDAVVQDVMER